MPNIEPISELRNYGELLREVTVGSPVFLTKNGHDRYDCYGSCTIMMKCRLTLELMDEISQGTHVRRRAGLD